MMMDYDLLGFDTCLVTYTQEMTRLLIETYLRDLMEHFHYPLEIMQVDLNACQTNLKVDSTCVWDIEHGNILTLTGGRLITEAINGFEVLSKERVEEIYGLPPVFLPLRDTDRIHTIEQKKGGYWILTGYFDSCKIPVVCQLTHYAKRGLVKKTYQQIAYDLLEVHKR